MLEDLQKKALDKAIEKADLNHKETKFVIKYGKAFVFFVWAIMKGIAVIWIAFRIYDRVGFEKTIIIQLCILAFLLRSTLKKQEIEETFK